MRKLWILALLLASAYAQQPVNVVNTPTVNAAQSGNWSVRNQDGAGNNLTTNSTTYTSKFALDVNFLGTLGTAFSTAGFVDIKGADGNVFVRQTSGANLHVNVDSAPTTAVTCSNCSGTVTVSASGNFNNASVGSTGSAVPSSGTYAAGNGSGNLTGIITCDNSTAFSISSATTTQVIAASGTSGRTYICSMNIVASAADNVALVSGTNSGSCGSPAGLAGGTTAATGWNFAANGGLTMGSGLGMIIRTATTNNAVCLITSSTAQLSGSIAWTQF